VAGLYRSVKLGRHVPDQSLKLPLLRGSEENPLLARKSFRLRISVPVGHRWHYLLPAANADKPWRTGRLLISWNRSSFRASWLRIEN
jgi:hypothetical protein